MKTILLSLALGALFFAGGLRVVETRAQDVPRVVELPPPSIPEAPPEIVVLEVEEPIEVHPVSRAGVKWKKTRVVRVRDIEDHSFSRYGGLGLRKVSPPPAPARID